MVQFERRWLEAEQINMVTDTGKKKEIDLPRDKFIKGIILHQYGDLDMGAGEPAAGDTRAVFPTLIGELELKRDGGESIISADTELLGRMDYVEHRGMPNFVIPNLQNATDQVWHSFLYLDFAVDPNDPEEAILRDEHGNLMTLMLPAMNYSSLKLKLNIDASLAANALAGIFGTSPVISNATAKLDITLIEAFLEDSDPELTEADVFEQRQITNTKVFGNVAYDAFPVNLTVGVLYRRFGLFIESAAGTPVNPHVDGTGAGAVTRYKVAQQSPVRWTIRDESFLSSQMSDMEEYRLPQSLEPQEDLIGSVGVSKTSFLGISNGFTIVDFDEGRSLNGARDFTDLKSGDVQVQLKTVAGAAGAQATLIEQYII